MFKATYCKDIHLAWLSKRIPADSYRLLPYDFDTGFAKGEQREEQ